MKSDFCSKWLKSLNGSAGRVRLFVFPYAGGGSGGFRAWRDRLPSWISIELIQLPGRESRYSEAPASQLSDITAPVTEAIMQRDDIPIVLFGHSMGSLLAFEVARELRRRGGRQPSALVVSGRCAPQLVNRTPRLAHLDGSELIGRVTELYGGIPNTAIEDPELVEMMARTLRPDLRIVEAYRYLPEPPLQYPLAAFGGNQDPLVNSTELNAWREHAGGTFTSEILSGDHFYLRSGKGEDALLENLERICASVA